MTSDLVSPRRSEAKPARELSPEQAAAAAMVAEAKARGLALTGPDGLLKLFTKNVLETALNEEMTEHLGHEKNRVEPERESRNVRNGSRSKTVLSDAAGEVEINVPRDRESTFEPQIVKKRQRRLTDVDEIVLSLYAKGMTTGEISAHFAEIYGASVSKETVSRITEKVVAEMNDWASRPLDSVYAAVQQEPSRPSAAVDLARLIAATKTGHLDHRSGSV
jgi:putative transposase